MPIEKIDCFTKFFTVIRLNSTGQGRFQSEFLNSGCDVRELVLEGGDKTRNKRIYCAGNT